MAGTVQVQDILNPGLDVVTVREDTTAYEAAQTMTERGIGSILVTQGDDHEVSGIMTERDLMTKVIAAQRDPRTTRVRDVMSRDVISCEPQTTLTDVNEMMVRHNIRHMPVIENGRAKGILSSRDVQLNQLADVQGLVMTLARTVDRLAEMFPHLDTASGSADGTRER